jgi:ribosome modulation factor
MTRAREAIAAAYAAGGMAHLLGDSERTCPYSATRDPLLHAAWRIGWTASAAYQDRAVQEFSAVATSTHSA